MRQYGSLQGNPWDSDRDIRAAKARAVEDRFADKEIADQLELVTTWEEPDPFAEECGDTCMSCYPGRMVFEEKKVHGLLPKTCIDPVDPVDEREMWPAFAAYRED